MKTFQESQINKMVNTVSAWAKAANFPGEVNADNLEEIIKALAEHYIEFLAKKLDSGYDLAVRLYTGRGDDENYSLITDNLDNILLLLGIETDYPGLYPTFELDRGGKHFCEYNALGALRQHNNYWNHW